MGSMSSMSITTEVSRIPFGRLGTRFWIGAGDSIEVFTKAGVADSWSPTEDLKDRSETYALALPQWN